MSHSLTIHTVLALDWGRRRTGVAVGNTLTRTAKPLRSLATQAIPNWKALHDLMAEWKPQVLVVGLPFHPDGKPHHNTRQVRHFIADLRKTFTCRIVEVDERYSTCEALSRDAADADAEAACVILEQYLTSNDEQLSS